MSQRTAKHPIASRPNANKAAEAEVLARAFWVGRLPCKSVIDDSGANTVRIRAITKDTYELWAPDTDQNR